MATKRELLEMLKPYDEDAVVILMGCNGWDNIGGVTSSPGLITIHFDAPPDRN